MGVSAGTLNVGESRSMVVADNLTRTQIVMYAGASGDYNPLHTDEIYTTQVAGYPSVFHGRHAQHGRHRQFILLDGGIAYHR